MKIDDLTITLFAWDGIPATRYGGHTGTFAGQSNLGLLTIRTDDGIEGHAFLGSAMFPADQDGPSLVRALKPLVMGRDPRDREAIYGAMQKRGRYVTLRAIGAVDVALWDIAAKASGQPLYKHLGAYRESIPAYASSAVLASREAYAEEAVGFRDGGWAAYKIHPPGPWQEDIEICQAVRAAVGPEYRLMLDSTWSYKYEHAIKVGRAIEQLGFYWYEDPLADDDLMGCIKLREKLDIPLMATEYSPGGFTNYAPWILNKATDYLRGDVAVKGGITALLKTAHLAEAFAMNYEIHHGGNSLNNWANLHVALSIPNTQFFEVLLPAQAQKYAIIDDLEPDAQGFIHAPSTPGLGAVIDFELIQAKTIGILS
ncbi:enolase C-terminal domain-like protein [Thalassobaculum sp.]|uniref:enolase C-terminal domain-like protein n=1 Tax=Thalassobaculum sp. TaxID=2022740 RepID=UPI0032EC7B7F